jgi:hypothetical protein
MARIFMIIFKESVSTFHLHSEMQDEKNVSQFSFKRSHRGAGKLLKKSAKQSINTRLMRNSSKCSSGKGNWIS